MVCCLMLGVLAGLLRSLWGMLTLQGRGERVLFAPVASRPAPQDWTTTSDEPLMHASPGTPPSITSVTTDSAVSFLLPVCLAAIGLYLCLVPLLQSAGVLLYDASAVAWLFRSLTIGTVAVVLARRWLNGQPGGESVPQLRLRKAGVALHAAGLLWLALVLADLHVFSVLHPSGVASGACPETLWWSVKAHDYRTYLWLGGPGVTALLIGWWMYRRGVPRPPSDGSASLSQHSTYFRTESLEHASRG